MPPTDPQKPESKTPAVSSSIGESKTQQESKQSNNSSEEIRDVDQGREGNGEDEEEEEEGECGFCLFMKEGGCRDAFIGWENCIQEADKNKEDVVEKCFEVTGALKKCMEAHADYYEPILRAEKAAQEEAKKELEKEVEKIAAETEAVIVLDSENSEAKEASSGK